MIQQQGWSLECPLKITQKLQDPELPGHFEELMTMAPQRPAIPKEGEEAYTEADWLRTAPWPWQFISPKKVFKLKRTRRLFGISTVDAVVVLKLLGILSRLRRRPCIGDLPYKCKMW